MRLLPLILAAWPFAAAAADGDVEFGRELYHELCASCHGRDMVNPGGVTFDLRKFPRDDTTRFRNAVLNGKGNAMPGLAGKIEEDDVANLWAYVKSGG